MPSAARFAAGCAWMCFAAIGLCLVARGDVTRGAPDTPAAPAAVLSGQPPNAELADKGSSLYAKDCAICHGAAAGGGPGGAPNLTASAIAMANDGGAQLAAFLVNGRPDRGMPAHPVSEEEAVHLSARLRAFGFNSTATVAKERVLVGDASAGRAFFNGPVGNCHRCHAVRPDEPAGAADLSMVGAKYPDPKSLQNAMILPHRRWYWSPANSKDVTAEVSFRDGRHEHGYLSSVSDFKVIIRDERGVERSFARSNGEPKVQLQDRLQAHLDLLPRYKDNDIHDLTAYLATLR